MARKEHKGGELTNDRIEQEGAQRGDDDAATRSYHGSQDTGDETVRAKGTTVQQEDGAGDEEQHTGEE